MASLPLEESVLLIGHSMGGALISLAMERFPQKVSVGVYVSALMLGPQLDSLTVSQEVIILSMLHNFFF